MRQQIKKSATYLSAAIVLLLASCNPCKDTECKNKGECITSGAGKGDCDCPKGTSGVNCEIIAKTGVLGHYRGSEACQGFSNDNMQVFIKDRPGNNQLYVDIVVSEVDTQYYECQMTSLTRFEQVGSNNGEIIVGTIEGDTLSYIKQINYPPYTIGCAFHGVRDTL